VDLAEIGALVGERVRAALLQQLMDGGATRASDLAVAVGASPSLTSAHLRKLLDGGLVEVDASGRTRHYRLASVEVAEMLEAMQTLTTAPTATSLRRAHGKRRLRRARLCYDHLAGVLGIGVTDALVARRVLDGADGTLALGAEAGAVLAEVGVDLEPVLAAARPTVRQCVDWTERRPHVAGGLGAAVAARMLEARWVVRRQGSRGLDVTVDGARVLEGWLGVRIDEAAGSREGA
jgi:DNA-binding transcriptional ArsR family regulator